MADRIEDYAIVGDMQSVALISTDGAVDWLCLPRFDSEAPFAGVDPEPPDIPEMSAGACQARHISMNKQTAR